MKSSISFVCQECGYESMRWLGKCPECGEWNSLREVQSSFGDRRIKVQSFGTKERGKTDSVPKKLEEIKLEEDLRIKTGFLELDNVLGGGIVKGSVILLAGDPGVGKSTLLLQIALTLDNSAVMYVSAEESAQQVKMRAKRIFKNPEKSNLSILSSTSTDLTVSTILKTEPHLVVIDSIQTMESENVGGLSGSIPQVRYAASQFVKIAKNLNIPIIIVGHVTKEGMVAGPMVLSHMVDVVLFLEGERLTRIKILRSLKNRFGSLDEVGIFVMEEEGMKQIDDSVEIFLTKNDIKNAIGSILTVALEGKRPFLVEIQALVVSSHLPVPRRVASGVDYKRLELLLAVLQKHCKVPIGTMDVFLNVAGGLKLSDPGADLAICLAVLSSFKNISLSNVVAISEVGLLGELRPVQFIEKRVREAKKLGFKNIITSQEFSSLNEAIRSLRK